VALALFRYSRGRELMTCNFDAVTLTRDPQ
jgi:hypothetical protein